MARSFSDTLIKGIEYLQLPFQYRHRFAALAWKILSDRRLVHELPRLNSHRDWLRSAGIQTVIDVGGFVGSFAYAVRTILPEVQIYSFEPVDENFASLEKNLSSPGHFQAFQTALGNRSGSIDFFRNDFVASSSVLEMADLHRQAFPQTEHQVKVTVPVARLDDYLGKMTLQKRALLKIDVQGYEAVILEGAKETLKQVDYLLTEVSYQTLYKDQPLFDEMNTLITAQGFGYAGTFDSMFSPLDGSILQSDALFIRREAG